MPASPPSARRGRGPGPSCRTGRPRWPSPGRRGSPGDRQASAAKAPSALREIEHADARGARRRGCRRADARARARGRRARAGSAPAGQRTRQVRDPEAGQGEEEGAPDRGDHRRGRRRSAGGGLADPEPRHRLDGFERWSPARRRSASGSSARRYSLRCSSQILGIEHLVGDRG